MKFSIKTLMIIAVLIAIAAGPIGSALRKERKLDLIEAVEMGNVDRVEKLLEIYDVNERISGMGFLDSNSSLLITAAKKSNTEMVRLLLKHGADPAIQDNSGYAAIHFVAENYNAYGNKSPGHLERDLDVLNALVVCTPQLSPARNEKTPLSKARYRPSTTRQHQELYDRKIQILQEWITNTESTFGGSLIE